MFKVGDVINNGFYDIELIEEPRYYDTHDRWMCRGYRWLKSRNEWEYKPRLYGWRDAKIVTAADD